MEHIPTQHSGWHRKLVLTKDPSTYGSGELEQVRNYVLASYPANLPPILSWIQGGNSCRGDFQITNISKNTLQLLNLVQRIISAFRV